MLKEFIHDYIYINNQFFPVSNSSFVIYCVCIYSSTYINIHYSTVKINTYMISLYYSSLLSSIVADVNYCFPQLCEGKKKNLKFQKSSSNLCDFFFFLKQEKRENKNPIFFFVKKFFIKRITRKKSYQVSKTVMDTRYKYLNGDVDFLENVDKIIPRRMELPLLMQTS